LGINVRFTLKKLEQKCAEGAFERNVLLQLQLAPLHIGVMSTNGGVGGVFRKLSPGRYALALTPELAGGGAKAGEKEEAAINSEVLTMATGGSGPGEEEEEEVPAGATGDILTMATGAAGSILEQQHPLQVSMEPPLSLSLEQRVDAAWASLAHSPMDASVDGVGAAREAWVCCDAPECGKWRRIPSLVAKLIGDGDRWLCKEVRDVRMNSCGAGQELDNDEIDRRINAAAVAEAGALAAAAAATSAAATAAASAAAVSAMNQAKRTRKRKLGAGEEEEEEVPAGATGDILTMVTGAAGCTLEQQHPLQVSMEPPLSLSLEQRVDAAWASLAHSPMDASVDGVGAAREAWVCCDAPTCGKWRRIPSLVAKLIGDGDRWLCKEVRDVRMNSCGAGQELDNDEIDRRINAAAVAEAGALAAATAAAKDQAKRTRKRNLDMAYRARKKARLVMEMREQRIAAGLSPDPPSRNGLPRKGKGVKPWLPDVRALLGVVEGDDASGDPGYVCVVLVPCAASPQGSENERWGRPALNAGAVAGVGGWRVPKRKRTQQERDDRPVVKHARNMKRLHREADIHNSLKAGTGFKKAGRQKGKVEVKTKTKMNHARRNVSRKAGLCTMC